MWRQKAAHSFEWEDCGFAVDLLGAALHPLERLKLGAQERHFAENGQVDASSHEWGHGQSLF